jgi:uncharacterized membrane protein YhaH (DUF805 family)
MQQNPYATPNANVEVMSDEGFGSLKLFTANGRLGRIRYLMYTMGIGLVGGIIAALMMAIPVVGPFLAVAMYIALMVVTIFLTIQRCHDFNTTGWLSLLILVPLVSLIFYFIPGTKGSNQYGLQPPPNSTAIKVGAFLLLGLFVIGILAAIAIPAYQDYALRAAMGN